METVPQNGRTPQPVSSYDWETGIYRYDVSQMDATQIWRGAVALAATKARQALPQSHGRIEAATQLVLAGHVAINPDRTAAVRSASQPDVTYTVDGSCPCQDFPRAPERACKHTIARGMVLRAVQFAKEMCTADGLVTLRSDAVQAPPEPAPTAPPLLPPPDTGDVTTAAPEPPEPTIPPQFVVTIQHKPFVLFAGLLTLAHARGLLSLKVTFISVTSELALCAAVATFKDGSVFADVGDASPSNVNKAVAKHFPRVAATRAAARALRHGLNVNMVAFEELD